jgi:hypothetical protein
MRIHELLEDASAGSTSSGSIATVVNPHVTNPYLGGSRKPKHKLPKKQKPTDNALNMNVSLFGGGMLSR